MRIALVSPYDCGHPGGVCTHIAGLRREFARAGHSVRVIVPRSGDGGPPDAADRIEIGRSIAIRGNGSRARITVDPGQFRAVRRLMARERFDVVHLHEPFIPLLPITVLYASSAVNVATFHTSRTSSPWYATFRPYLRSLLPRLHARIAVSEAARSLARRYFPGTYELIPNAIDLAAFQEPAESLRSGSPPRVLFVGRYDEPRKGFEHLLAAMVVVRRELPTSELVVVGEGHRGRRRALLSALDPGAVRFAGRVPDAELRSLYRSSDVLCAPSVGGESFGMVLLEAMAAGLPVVASDIPGYRELATDSKEGLLVEPGDSDALGDAIVRVLADAGLARSLGRAGTATASNYSLARVASRVLDLYGERIEARGVGNVAMS